MSLLRGFLRFVVDRMMRQIRVADLRPDQLAHFGQRRLGDARRVRAHIGDQSHRAFLGEFNTFVQALSQKHGFLDGKVQPARRFLLQIAGDKWWNWVALFLAPVHGFDEKRRVAELLYDCMRRFCVADLPFRAVIIRGFGRELGRRMTGEARGEIPVFLRFERADLVLALDDHAQRDRLDTARRQSASHLFPKQRADLVTYEPVEDAPCQLGLDLVRVDPAGVLECLLNGVFGDFVEQNSINVLGLAPEFFRQMLADCLTFSVRVCGKVYDRRSLGGGPQFANDLFLRRDDAVMRHESIFDVDSQLVLGQVFDMSYRCFYVKTPAEILLDRLCLGGRFDYDQRICHKRGHTITAISRIPRKIIRHGERFEQTDFPVPAASTPAFPG